MRIPLETVGYVLAICLRDEWNFLIIRIIFLYNFFVFHAYLFKYLNMFLSIPEVRKTDLRIRRLIKEALNLFVMISLLSVFLFRYKFKNVDQSPSKMDFSFSKINDTKSDFSTMQSYVDVDSQSQVLLPDRGRAPKVCY